MASLANLYELFYLSGYEFNSRCKKTIQDVLFAHEYESPYCFFEFFLSQPLSLSAGASDRELTEHAYVLAPFASRMVEHCPVVPRIRPNEEVDLTYRTPDVLRTLRLYFPWERSAFTKDAWTFLRDTSHCGFRHETLSVEFALHSDGTTGHAHAIGMVNGWSLDWQERLYEGGASGCAKALVELYRPLFRRDHTTVPCLFVPLASASIYYGGIWIMLPGLTPNTPDTRKLCEAVGLGVARLAHRCYTPALAVLHQHWMEKTLRSQLDQLSEADRRRLFPEKPDLPGDRQHREICDERLGRLTIRDFKGASIRYYNPFTRPRNEGMRKASIADCLEGAFADLWHRRETLTEIKPLAEDLLFRKYIVSSEKMIHLLHDVIKSATNLRKSQDTLPACLVVGGAGSGKETLAAMLKLFSREYWNGRKYVLNMASIRPGPLTSALMAGIQTSGKIGATDGALAIEGLLGQIRRSQRDPVGRTVTTCDALAPTIILDEFNSMDPDSQGVLLRFLDNSEIVPLGGIEDGVGKEQTNCLVIGVMNENPDDISRERAVDFFRNDSYLGRFIGDLLYEHFMQIRRLRPDIKYRMIRNGKFIIPPLKERGEDIPMLFHVFVRLEIENLLRSSGLSPEGGVADLTVHLPLDVLDRLTSSDLHWPGNVRQLQALAKLVSLALWTQRHVNGDMSYTVRLRDLEQAMIEVELVPPGAPS